AAPPRTQRHVGRNVGPERAAEAADLRRAPLAQPRMAFAGYREPPARLAVVQGALRTSTMDRLLRALITRLIRHGRLSVTSASGTTMTFGDGAGPPIAVRFTPRPAKVAAPSEPGRRLGGAYRDGALVGGGGSTAALLEVVMGGEYAHTPRWPPPIVALGGAGRWLKHLNRRGGPRR